MTSYPKPRILSASPQMHFYTALDRWVELGGNFDGTGGNIVWLLSVVLPEKLRVSTLIFFGKLQEQVSRLVKQRHHQVCYLKMDGTVPELMGAGSWKTEQERLACRLLPGGKPRFWDPAVNLGTSVLRTVLSRKQLLVSGSTR